MRESLGVSITSALFKVETVSIGLKVPLFKKQCILILHKTHLYYYYYEEENHKQFNPSSLWLICWSHGKGYDVSSFYGIIAGGSTR